MNLYLRLAREGAWSAGSVFAREPATGRSWTYGELEAESARLARALVVDFGVRPGDRVAAQVEKSIPAFFLYLACLRTGAVFLPMNPAYSRDETAYLIDDARPVLFVLDPVRHEELEPIAAASGARVATLDTQGEGSLREATRAAAARFETVERADDDLAAILYTSGTTGRPKGAMITHGNLASNARALADAWGFTADDVLLHALPTFHVHGLFISLNCALIAGASVVWLPRFDAPETLRHLAEATVFMGVPTYYTRLLELPGLTPERVSGVRLFVSGSAPLLPETFARFAERTGQRPIERYGMTETGVIASNPLRGERVPGAVGRALPGVEVRLGEGEVIEVRGPNVFRGYWNRPEQTRAEFRPDGWFVTGDVGAYDPDGSLRIVGRAKDLVITGGLNVYPIEIEQVLDGLPGVRESAVFGVPHPDFGEAVVAAVVPSDPAHPPVEAELITAARARLAAYKTPKRVLLLDELPRNALGKVQKARLRESWAGLFRA